MAVKQTLTLCLAATVRLLWWGGHHCGVVWVKEGREGAERRIVEQLKVCEKQTDGGKAQPDAEIS